jgi:hypothetical protein
MPSHLFITLHEGPTFVYESATMRQCAFIGTKSGMTLDDVCPGIYEPVGDYIEPRSTVDEF